jgi:hypothetical protein
MIIHFPLCFKNHLKCISYKSTETENESGFNLEVIPKQIKFVTQIAFI